MKRSGLAGGKYSSYNASSSSTRTNVVPPSSSSSSTNLIAGGKKNQQQSASTRTQSSSSSSSLSSSNNKKDSQADNQNQQPVKNNTTTTTTSSSSNPNSRNLSRRTSFLRDKIQDAQQQAFEHNNNNSNMTNHHQESTTATIDDYKKNTVTTTKKKTPAAAETSTSSKKEPERVTNNNTADTTIDENLQNKKEGERVEERQENLELIVDKIKSEQQQIIISKNSDSSSLPSFFDPLSSAFEISESLAKYASATGKKATTNVPAGVSLTSSQSPSPTRTNNMTTTSGPKEMIGVISNLISSHSSNSSTDKENNNNKEDDDHKQEEPSIIFNAILSEKQHRQQSTKSSSSLSNNKKQPPPTTTTTTKKPSSLLPVSNKKTQQQQVEEPKWTVVNSEKTSSSSSTFTVTGSNLVLPQQVAKQNTNSKKASMMMNSTTTIDVSVDLKVFPNHNDEASLPVSSSFCCCDNCCSLSSVSLDSKYIDLPKKSKSTKSDDTRRSLCQKCLIALKKNDDDNIMKKKNQQDDDEEPLNEWQMKAKQIQDGSSDPFQIQKNGWSSAQICGRTCPLSVTCLVEKKKNQNNTESNNNSHHHNQNDIELRHVGGATSSLTITATSSPSSAQRTLTSSSLPNFKITTTTSTTNDEDEKENNNNSHSTASYRLVPSGKDCTISSSSSSSTTNTKNSTALMMIKYTGPLKFGSRHNSSSSSIGNIMINNSNDATTNTSSSLSGVGTLEVSFQNNNNKDTNFNNNNTNNNKQFFFDRFKYSGHWSRDSFVGPGSLLSSWFADKSGAGSGQILISSSNWQTLAGVSSKNSLSSSASSTPHLLSLKMLKGSDEGENENALSMIRNRDPFALHFAHHHHQTGSNNSSSSSSSNSPCLFVQFVCEGKTLPLPTTTTNTDAASSSTQQQQQQKKCLHVFQTTSHPTLKFLLDSKQDLQHRNDSFSYLEQSSLKPDEMIVCRDGEEDLLAVTEDENNNNNHQNNSSETTTTTLGALLAMRRSSGTTSPTTSSNNNNNNSTITNHHQHNTPSKLLLALANADLLQSLFARTRKNLAEVDQKETHQKSVTQKAASLEASLVASTWNWNLFSEIVRIAREDYVEPRKFEVSRLETSLANTKKKLEGEQKKQKDLEGTIENAEEALKLQKNQQDGSSVDGNIINNTNNTKTLSLEEIQEQIEQTHVDTEAAKVSVEEQKQNLLQLKEEIRIAESRVKQLDIDVDALQKEQDLCSEKKRTLAKKRTTLEDDRKKQNVAYAAATKKLDELKNDMTRLQAKYFVDVIEPQARDELISNFFLNSAASPPAAGSSSNSNNSSTSTISFSSAPKHIENLTSNYEKKRHECIQAVSKTKSSISSLLDEKEKLQKTIKETPDESALLVAFQSAEAQSEIILSRIRSMQQSGFIGGGVGGSGLSKINTDNNNSDNLLELGESGLRSKHATTMSSFSKRLAEIREAIRKETDREAELVKEMEKLQKENGNGGSYSGATPLRVKATAPVADEFFTGKNSKRKKNNNNSDINDDSSNNHNDDKTNASSPQTSGRGTADAADEALKNKQQATSAKAKKELQSLKTEIKSANNEMREMKYLLKSATPSLLLLDSTQLASLSNDLLRKLLHEAKNPQRARQDEGDDEESGTFPNNNNKTHQSFGIASSPLVDRNNNNQQQQLYYTSSNSNSSSHSTSAPPWSLNEALKDKDSKNKTLQYALSQCDAQIAELRLKAQRVKQLESKLEVTMDAASVAQASAQVKSSHRMNINNMMMQQQQDKNHQNQQQPRNSFSGIPGLMMSNNNNQYNHKFASSANSATKMGNSGPLLPSLK